MTPIQQLFLGAGVVAKKTYLDDVFSTYLWKGTGSAKTITNGIDLSGEGGLTFIKNRDSTNGWQWVDTVRGATKWITSHGNDAEYTYSNGLTAFNNNGFTLGNHASYNGSGDDYGSWTFRKAPGFFDVVTYTGTGSSQDISHSLGSIPGCIMIKRTNDTQDWCVHHRETGVNKILYLNGQSGAATNTTSITAVTSTSFTVGTAGIVNGSSDTYIAYVFAGGESTDATARSVKCNGGSVLVNDDSDLDIGSGDFTIEFWFKPLSGSDHHSLLALGNYGSGNASHVSLEIYEHNKGHKIFLMTGGGYTDISSKQNLFGYGTWTHFAWTRSGSGTNNNKVFINGTLVDQFSNNFDVTDGQDWIIGANNWSQDGTPNEYTFDGYMSNLRFTKGQVLYTTSFKPSTTPLTTTSQGATASNVKLLCLNNSSVTGSTVSPTSLESHGTAATASTDSPFDDPAGFVFGDSEEGIIKCGSYIGDGASPGVKVDIGFEPQFIMLKRTDTTANWAMVDSMRGITHQGTDEFLFPNLNNADQASTYIELTSTGFQLYNGNFLNQSGASYIYLAIRRPDGYVGKTRTATELFAMDVGNSDADIPNFDSTFPVDFALIKATASSSDWRAGSRLIGTKYLKTNDNSTETNNNDHTWDSNVGIYKNFFSDAMQAWMWKRHAGFDVVTYKGDGVTTGRDVPHSMNAIPQMMWVKKRNSSTYTDWICYHVGVGNTKYLRLSDTTAPATTINTWNNTTPTATHFTIGQSPEANNDGDDFIAMLFASVDGISKVGSYTGNGNAGQTITTGFQPRFLIIKLTTGSTLRSWYVFDTTRGWGSGNDQWLELNEPNAQFAYDAGQPTSTGFTLADGTISYNGSGETYIYYAHA